MLWASQRSIQSEVPSRTSHNGYRAGLSRQTQVRLGSKAPVRRRPLHVSFSLGSRRLMHGRRGARCQRRGIAPIAISATQSTGHRCNNDFLARSLVAGLPHYAGREAMFTVTVFGGSGFLGRRLVRRLVAEGAAARVVVRRPTGACRPACGGVGRGRGLPRRRARPQLARCGPCGDRRRRERGLRLRRETWCDFRSHSRAGCGGSRAKSR